MKEVRPCLFLELTQQLKARVDGFGERLGGGVIFASPGISEKGYLDVRIEVVLPGGHSSIPPPHTVLITSHLKSNAFILI